jgi:hypothetical protein
LKKSYQDIINDLINRLYSRPDQNARRKILIAYLTQYPGRRSLTQDDLGRIGGVTGERARVILGEFNDYEFSKKIKLLQINRSGGDSLGNGEVLRNLYSVIQEIIDEVRSFDIPVFAKNVQDNLQNKGVLDHHIQIPIVCNLARILNIPTNFKLENFNGHNIIVNPDDENGKYTQGIISHAAKIATHCSGVFSVDRLVNSDWDTKAPKAINNIPASIRRSFVLEILNTEPSLMLLQNSDFFAFRDRDERISSVLTPIFYSYKTPIDKTILVNAVQRAIKLRLMQKKDSRQSVFVDVLENSGLAIDEYCRRTLLLDTDNIHYRTPGVKLARKIENYQLGEIYNNQYIILEKIRENGSPVDSSLFGEFSADMPEAQNGHFYSYSVLFYKEGEGRRRDLYKTLDGVYSVLENVNNNFYDLESRVGVIKEKIQKLLEELNSLDLSSDGKVTHRAEQVLLRELLMLLSPKAKMSSNLSASRCQICNKYYPAQLLVAAHVKPRSKCSLEEKSDIENIAMLQCKSCDALYENGYISVNELGIVITTDNLPMTEDLKILVSQIAGNSCDYLNGNEKRLSYLKFHRENIFNN